MMLRSIFTLMVAATVATVVSGASITLGQQKFFRSWAVACDNALTCEAINLPPENEQDDALAVVIRKGYRPGDALSVSISGFETTNDRYHLKVDGRETDSGPLAPFQREILLADKEALKIVRALARGNRFVLLDGAGTRLGSGSLAGSAAALKYIDAIQNRIGSKDALAGGGRKSTKPAWLPLPVVKAIRIGTTAPIPGTPELIDLIEKSPCRDERFGVTEDSAYSLGRSSGNARAMVLISCGSGAYNMSHTPYVGTQNASGKWFFEPAKFDYATEPADGPKLLVNASWDPQKQQLDSFSKARGVGDCGNAESYIWDGTMFRLTSAIGMDECRGSLNWLTLWRADVELLDR